MQDNTIDSLITKIKENKEMYRRKSSGASEHDLLIKESNLRKFDWCVLNLKDSLSFQKAEQYYEYAQSIGRAIKRNKCKDRLVIESFRLIYTYMLHRSNSQVKEK